MTYDPDKLIAHYRAQAMRGLVAGAADAEEALIRTRAHGDITGATRDSYSVYAVGEGAPSEASKVQAALSAVARLNPGAEAVASYTLPADTLAVVITGFTSYLADLQVEYAGAKAALLPTLQQYAAEFVRRAAEGK